MLPCGLGARNTLRLEASIACTANENLNEDERRRGKRDSMDFANPGKRGEFLGRDACFAEKEKGAERALRWGCKCSIA